ncbi:unannotated protein [freshwater metagenome]|uniref:Unannotated protein n=1 Tax=freshwater metagenome TaxID=449393 RepID=A0A6J7KZM4_9ZZZZ|nr:hypothetical protein [Actinomycetota bacterium]
MRILLIVNTAASSFSARKRVVIQKALSSDHEVEVVETVRGGHATRLAHTAASDGVDVVAVLGGDGTLNEAANGLVDSATALAPLPGGSTNVYARTIGVANDAVEATGQLLASLERESFRRVALGRVEDRYFLFHCGVGFDAAVVEKVEARRGLKKIAPHPFFAMNAFDAWLRTYDHKKSRFTVELDDGTKIDGGTMAIAAVSTPYTFIGKRPIVVTPNASLDSGFSLAVVQAHRSLPMIGLVSRAIIGQHGLGRTHAAVVKDDLSEFTIEADIPVPYQADGEFLGEATKLRFTHHPKALNIVMPTS